jgi:hypothetical protein
MGWEYRKGTRYYYRKERQGNRVVSTYIGPAGDRAALFAEIDALDRQRRQQERWEAQIARAQFAELASAPEGLTELLAEAKRAAAEALTAAGYHQHKRGQWRKRRRGTNQDKDQGAHS